MTAQATAIMLSLVMAFTVFPMSAAAATGNGDDGTAAAEEAVTPDYEPGELIVVTEQNTSKKQMKSIVEGVDGQVDTMSALGDGSKMALIEVEEGSELEAAAELECEDEVLYVQPNYIYELEEDEFTDEQTLNESSNAENGDDSEVRDSVEYPNDPIYHGNYSDDQGDYAGQKRYLAPVGDGGEPGSINAKGAWDQLAEFESHLEEPDEQKKPVVAVIDTGVYFKHEDLNGHDGEGPIIENKCVTFNNGQKLRFEDGDNAPDDNGHGTRLTGVIGANLHNLTGIAGIAGNRVNIFVVDDNMPKANPRDPDVVYSIDIAKGIYYAIDKNQGANLINLSVGFYGSDYLCEGAVKEAWDNGTLCVCSAGNVETDETHYPGDSLYAITVMGHNLDGSPVGNSAYGLEKDVSAPGDYLHTTRVNGYAIRFDGTSVAAAVVTGSAALLLYADPDLTPREIKNLLYTSTGKEDFSPAKGGQGFGRININTALENLLADKTDPEKIVINKTSINLNEGAKTGIEYAVYPGNTNTTDVTFTSSNEDVATVDGDGMITAKAPGTATITVSCGTCEDVQCEVTVNGNQHKTIDQKPYCTEDHFTLTELTDYVDEVNSAGEVIDGHGYYYHQYNINLEENETISVGMTGNNFGPFLRIKDQNGDTVAVGVGDWDERGDIHKEEFHSTVTCKAEQAGTYIIQAIRLVSKGRFGTDYDLKLASDRVLCKPKVKSIGNGQMCMSWSAVDNTDYYLVRKYAKYADIAQAKPEIKEKVDATEYTDTAYDKTKANYYTVTACMETNAGVLYNGESKLFIKLKNPLLMKGQKVKVKRKTLKKKSVKLPRSKVIKFTKAAKDKKTYTLLSAKKGKKGFKKYFRINKTTGKVTIKKGLKKGTYKVKVRVKAAGNVKYKTITKDVTFKIKVK